MSEKHIGFVLIAVALSQSSLAQTKKTGTTAQPAKLGVNGKPCVPVSPNRTGSLASTVVAHPADSWAPKLIKRPLPDTDTDGHHLNTGVDDNPDAPTVPDVSGDNNESNAGDALQNESDGREDAANRENGRPTTGTGKPTANSQNSNGSQTTAPPNADGSGCPRP